MQTFYPGDHLVTNIDPLGITEHHGLHVGHGQVIHLGKDGFICEDSLSNFAEGQEIRFVASAYDCSMAIHRARSQLGQRDYQLFQNNCEHFVHWCLDKPHSSNQISNVIHLSVQGLAHSGLAGELCKRAALAPVAQIALVSTSAKWVADYLGVPKPITTLIGTPGDLLAKPMETLLISGLDTLDETANHLSNGNYTNAAQSLVTGSVKTLVSAAIVTPVNVAGDAIAASFELGRDLWWRFKH